jgi:LPXTG-motif cell wall-anchored protein
MSPKLFKSAVVLFLIVFSIAGGALLLKGLMTILRPNAGIFAFSGGVSVRELQFTLIGVALVALAIFVLRRVRRD